MMMTCERPAVAEKEREPSMTISPFTNLGIYLAGMGNSLLPVSLWKRASVIGLGILTACLGGLERPILNIILILWAADTLLGLGAALIKGEGISSKKLFYGACIKLPAYLLGIMVAWQIQRGLPYVGPLVGGLVEACILASEATSALRNLDRVVCIPGLRQIADLIEKETSAKVDTVAKKPEGGPPDAVPPKGLQ